MNNDQLQSALENEIKMIKRELESMRSMMDYQLKAMDYQMKAKEQTESDFTISIFRELEVMKFQIGQMNQIHLTKSKHETGFIRGRWFNSKLRGFLILILRKNSILFSYVQKIRLKLMD